THRRLVDVEVRQEGPRAPRVLARDHIDLAQDAQRAQADVFEVADRGRYDKKGAAQAVCSFASETRIGLSRFRMTSRVITHSFSPWIEGRSYMISSMTSSRMARSPRAPVPRLSASRAMAATASSVNLSRTFSRSKYFWYCLMIAFFGSRRVRTSAWSSRSWSVAITGRRAADSGGRPDVQKVFRLDHRQEVADAALVTALDLGPEAHARAAHAVLDDLVEPDEGAAAQEQHVRGVDLDELLVRVLAAALRRHVGDGALEDLQDRLLHALTGHVALYRRVLGLARDLVDLVDVHDAAFRPLDVVIGRLQQPQNDVLDVLADVARFRQRRGVGDRERNAEHLGERLRQQRLAGAGGADHEDVRLLQLDVARSAAAGLDPLVVVVHRHRQHLLGALLADHVLVEDGLDLGRLRQAPGLPRL